MDCKTPEGKKFMTHASDAVEIFNRNALNGTKFVYTHPDAPATLDGIIVTKGIVNGVVEIKSRQNTFEEICNFENHSGWLISANKILAGKKASEYFSCPFYGFLYCIPDKELYIIRIFNADTSNACPYEIKETKTQATCNGGDAERQNAYVKLDNKYLNMMK